MTPVITPPGPEAGRPTDTPPPGAPFGARVQRSFGRHAEDYEGQARLQQATAWRLGRLCAGLPLPSGPIADLGAGTGLLSRALLLHHPQLRQRPPLQLDLCPELLARNPLAGCTPPALADACSPPAALAACMDPPSGLVWDLNNGLPGHLGGAALLASSFALQWLEEPAGMLALWGHTLGPGGWLVLAVPTAGSFPQWRRAAERADVPCSALGLPDADMLIAATESCGLTLQHCRRRRFSRARQGGLPTLRHLRQLGAGTSRRPPLNAGQLRRLLRHWPAGGSLTWEVLLLLARRDS